LGEAWFKLAQYRAAWLPVPRILEITDDVGRDIVRARITRARRWRNRLLGGALIGIVIVIGSYFVHFRGLPFGTQEHWGQFGDYVGGLLNPIVALFALAALFQSIGIQQEELHATQTELAKAREIAAAQADHLTTQAKLDDLNRAAAALQVSIDEALNRRLPVGGMPGLGMEPGVEYVTTLAEALHWCGGFGGHEGEVPERIDPRNAHDVGAMLYNKSNHTPFVVTALCGDLARLLNALAAVLQSYAQLQPGAAVPEAYRIRNAEVVRSLVLAEYLDEKVEAIFDFAALGPDAAKASRGE